MAKNVQIGDVIEIKTALGFAYAQCTHYMPRWGHVIRVLPGAFERRPSSLDNIVSKSEQFVAFFPLRSAISRGLVQVVGSFPIPEAAKSFPVFRAAGATDKAGKVLNWSLWDGEKSRKVEALTPELRKLPVRGVLNHAGLVRRIERGWTPEKDAR